MIIRARIVLPLSRPPVENGAVIVSGKKILAVGGWSDISRYPSPGTRHDIIDLGEVVMLPGLINAHCHLDYTDMAGKLPPPRTFTDWIPLIMAAKAAWDYSDYARSWLNGAQMLLRTGCTTAADIEAVPDLLPELWDATPLRVFSFLEMTGIRARANPAAILRETVQKIESLAHPRCSAALSPHAPYSTVTKLLQSSASIAQERSWRITTHVAESEEEFEMFMRGRGRMYDWLRRNERDNSDCGHGSPVAHLARTGLLGENLLAVHVNCLAPGDIELLARNRVHVVHCPRSHDYFRHPPFAHRQLADAGINVCLATDSLSTVRKTGTKKLELSLFDEMRQLAGADKTISPAEILRLATVNGAKALGRAGQIGELSENACADLVAVPFTGKVADICESVVHHASTVSASMIDGEWAIAPK